MRNKLVIFLCGLAAGYVFHMLSTGNTPTPASEARCELPAETQGLSAQNVPTPKAPSPLPLQNARLPHGPDHAAATAVTANVTQPAPRTPAPRTPGPRPPEPETVSSLSIDERSVEEMEKSKDELREQVYTESTSEGWRVHVLREDNLLTRTGIRDGDVITTQSLNGQLQLPDRVRLAIRVTGILNYIQR